MQRRRHHGILHASDEPIRINQAGSAEFIKLGGFLGGELQVNGGQVIFELRHLIRAD